MKYLLLFVLILFACDDTLSDVKKKSRVDHVSVYLLSKEGILLGCHHPDFSFSWSMCSIEVKGCKYTITVNDSSIHDDNEYARCK